MEKIIGNYIFKDNKYGTAVIPKESIKEKTADEMKRRIEALVVKCDTCKMYECIGCEIFYNDIQAIKSLIKENNDLRQKIYMAGYVINKQTGLLEKRNTATEYVS